MRLLSKLHLARSGSRSEPKSESKSSLVGRCTIEDSIPVLASPSELDTTPSPPLSRLELLPPELRYHILSLLDLRNLSALIHASPMYLQQFLCDRRLLLCSSLEHALRPAVRDAHAVWELDRHRQHLVRIDPRVAVERLLPLRERLSESEAESMAGRFMDLVEPLVYRFVQWLVAEFEDSEKAEAERKRSRRRGHVE